MKGQTQQQLISSIEEGVNLTNFSRTPDGLIELLKACKERLEKQGSLSIDEYGSCRYRNAEFKACAIGMGIPQSSYNPELEGTVPNSKVFWHLLNTELPDEWIIAALDKMQYFHDIYDFDESIDSMEEYIREFKQTSRLD